MTRALVVSLVCGLGLAACTKLAELAGAPNRNVASITITVPDSLFVGDTVAINAQPLSADGRPAWGDTAVTWHTTDPGVLAFAARPLPSPAPTGFAWLVGKASGHATLTAQVAQVTASKVVTVVGPADIAAGDQRFGYALADQPSSPGPYSPDPAYRLNSSGGAVTITHDTVGFYVVRFAGLARKPGQRDNAQLTAYGSPPGVHCKLGNSQNDGVDMLVPVRCFAPGADGPFTDAKFTVLFAGARAFDQASPFAFAVRLPSTTNIVLDTSETAFNSATGHVTMGGNFTAWNFVFPGLEHPTAPVALLATGIGVGPEYCRVNNYDLTAAVLQASCAQPDGTPIAGRPSVMWFTRGRVGHRFAFVSTNNPSGVTPPNDPAFTLNSTGGAITVRRPSTGQYTATFAGLARPTGATEIVIVSAFKDFDHRCSITSWVT
ncbi:MAG TPA: hypothetical protein VFJ20_02640, partial [Gemmatimonadaceae bacterium]|nr:hypothetical protein [Gemmatimonadaceae bacterium]